MIPPVTISENVDISGRPLTLHFDCYIFCILDFSEHWAWLMEPLPIQWLQGTVRPASMEDATTDHLYLMLQTRACQHPIHWSNTNTNQSIPSLSVPYPARLTTLYCAPSRSELITNMQNCQVRHLISTKVRCALTKCEKVYVDTELHCEPWFACSLSTTKIPYYVSVPLCTTCVCLLSTYLENVP